MKLQFLDIMLAKDTKLAYKMNEEETRLWVWIGDSVEEAPKDAAIMQMPNYYPEGKKMWHWIEFDEEIHDQIIDEVNSISTVVIEDSEKLSKCKHGILESSYCSKCYSEDYYAEMAKGILIAWAIVFIPLFICMALFGDWIVNGQNIGTGIDIIIRIITNL